MVFAGANFPYYIGVLLKAPESRRNRGERGPARCPKDRRTGLQASRPKSAYSAFVACLFEPLVFVLQSQEGLNKLAKTASTPQFLRILTRIPGVSGLLFFP